MCSRVWQVWVDIPSASVCVRVCLPVCGCVNACLGVDYTGPWVFLRCCLSLSLKPCPSPSSGLGDPGARPSLVHSASLFSQCHSLPPPKLAWGSDLSSPRTGERKGGARSWRPLPPNTAAPAAPASKKTEEYGDRNRCLPTG